MRRIIGGLGVIGLLLALWVTPAAAQNGGDWRCVEVNGQVSLNIRSGAGINFDIVAQREPGAQLEADAEQAQSADGYNWLPVRDEGNQGWAVSARLTPCANHNTAAPAPAGDTVLQAVNQDGTLDRYEIAAIARSVVLIASLNGRRIEATGTGTITTPDGLIITNAHVIENADTIAVGLLNDINDPPEYLYLAEVVHQDDDVDVALLAIRTDLDGRAIDAASLNLPYLPASSGVHEVFRGDMIYIFGYPGIGNDYLVVTSGSIVSVENGLFNGQRMPLWYRTDAEIAPGNSGGLVVNGNGEFVGIPTVVRTEEETGGRLGGIRPADVALLAVIEEEQGEPAANTAPEHTAAEPVVVTFDRVNTQHGVVVGGLTGIEFHLAFTIHDWQERPATVIAQFYHDDLASDPLRYVGGQARYRDEQNGVITSVIILPCCLETIYDDLPLFIPYTALGLDRPGTYPLKIQIAVTGENWWQTLTWEFITYTRE
jgi:S1-C subfamily serine protease